MKSGSRKLPRHTVLSGYVRVVAMLACFLMSGLAPFPLVVSSVFAAAPLETESESEAPTSDSGEDERPSDSDPIPTPLTRSATAPISWQSQHGKLNLVPLLGVGSLRSLQTSPVARIARTSTLRC